MSDMTISPIFPIWVMAIICVFLLIPFRKGLFNYIRQILIVLVVFAINLRPMVPNGEVTEVTRDYKVLFVIDNTISMFAEDYANGKETRMDNVRKDITYIIDALDGASFATMKFDSEVRQLIPFTTDTVIVQQTVDTLYGQSVIYASGTTLNDVRDPLLEVVRQYQDDSIFVFFISDGEITKKGEENNLSSFESIRPYISGGGVLGYGTSAGGYMKAFTYGADDEREYIETNNGELAKSVINEDNLKKIAEDLGVDYVHMVKTSDMDSVIKKVNKQVEDIEASPKMKKLGYVDVYYWLAIPLVLLLGFDFIYYKKKSRVK